MKKSSTLCLLICLILTSFVPVRLSAAQIAAITTVGVFGKHAVAPGQRLVLPVEVKAAQNLYAVDLTLRFDSTLLKIVDADPKTPGIQVALGTFLDPGLLLSNEVDENMGELRFVMSQMTPSEAKSGGGALLVVTFEGLKEGVSDLRITTLEMSDRDGLAIVGIASDGQVTVQVGAPEQSDPGIPTQASGSVVVVPSTLPSPAVAATQQPTAALSGTFTTEPLPTATKHGGELTVETLSQSTQPLESQAQSPQKQGNSTLLIVFGVIGVLLVLIALFLLRKLPNAKPNQPGK